MDITKRTRHWVLFVINGQIFAHFPHGRQITSSWTFFCYFHSDINCQHEHISRQNSTNFNVKKSITTVFPHIVSAHLCTVTFGLMYCDLWISKLKREQFPRKIYEEIRYFTTNSRNLWSCLFTLKLSYKYTTFYLRSCYRWQCY